MQELREELWRLVCHQKSLVEALAQCGDCICAPEYAHVVQMEADMWKRAYETELAKVNARMKEVQRLLNERYGTSELERAYQKGRADALGVPYVEKEDIRQKGKEHIAKVKAESLAQLEETRTDIDAKINKLDARYDKVTYRILRERQEEAERACRKNVEKAKEWAIREFGYVE